MKRLLSLFLISIAVALPLAGCGSSSSSGSHHHVLSDIFCAVSVYSAYKDVKHHKLGWAAFQGLLAAHNCHQAFSKP
jgi:hypothetical protein